MIPCSMAASVPPAASMRSSRARASRLDAVGQLLDRVRAAERIDGVGHARFGGDHLLGSQRDPRRLFGRERQRLVAPVAVQRLRAAHHRRQRLQRDADDVVVGLLRGQGAAGRLGVEAQLLRARVAGAEPVAHDRGPQPARGAELRDLLEKIVVRVEEEREALAEAIDVEPGVDGRLDVRDRVREREGHLLDGRRSRLADVIPADRDRVPVRQLPLAEREDVGHDPERRPRRVDVGAARDVFLQDVVLNRAGERRPAQLPAGAPPRGTAPAG